VEIAVFLGKDQRGDLDNFAKVVIDGLVKASVIDTDSKVSELRMRKRRDWAHPRTEITVRAVEVE
jgi:Holliday junction resolvase RusA-like endonuclease